MDDPGADPPCPRTITMVTRRELLAAGAGTAAVLWIGGCGDDAGGAPPDGPPAPVIDADPNAPDADPTLDATPACVETEDNIEGPFYRAGAPDNAMLAPPGEPGVRLVVSGRVLTTGCAPLAGAVLDIWQADDAGAYDNLGYHLRGKAYSDAAGAYRFESIIPGHYLNGATYRPAHIHVKAQGTGTQLLTTQLYFAGDPYNATDPFILPPLIMTLEDAPAGGKTATFDFVLLAA